MKTSYKNILRFSAIAALFIIFSLIGVKITTNGSLLNITQPIVKNNKPNTDHNMTFDKKPDPTLPSEDNNNVPDSTGAANNDNVSDSTSAANNNNVSDSTSAADNNNVPDNGSTGNNSSAALPIPPSCSAGTKFTKVPAEYFNDALFIGDSRTVGLKEYGSAIKNATFFASTGMDIYQIYSIKINVGKLGKIDLMSLLKNNKYSKVYIMLGINELGYTFDNTIKKYSELIDTIKATQPGVIIYVAANMHVSESRSASDNIFNNTNINNFNNMLVKLADNKNAYYLDANLLFDDSNGNLRADYTQDNTHVLGKHYKTWADWITENAIIKSD